MISVEDTPEDPKERKSKRTLVLSLKEGKAPVSSTGLVDRRLFTGEQSLYAVMDKQSCLWSFQYEAGILPQPLKQKFTSFKQLHQFAENYFGNRNLNIVEVKD